MDLSDSSQKMPHKLFSFKQTFDTRSELWSPNYAAHVGSADKWSCLKMVLVGGT